MFIVVGLLYIIHMTPFPSQEMRSTTVQPGGNWLSQCQKIPSFLHQHICLLYHWNQHSSLHLLSFKFSPSSSFPSPLCCLHPSLHPCFPSSVRSNQSLCSVRGAPQLRGTFPVVMFKTLLFYRLSYPNLL